MLVYVLTPGLHDSSMLKHLDRCCSLLRMPEHVNIEHIIHAQDG